MDATTIRTAADLERVLAAALGRQDPTAWDAIEEQVRGVRGFRDAGLLTRDRGLVLRLANGSEYQVTIVRSAPPRAERAAVVPFARRGERGR